MIIRINVSKTLTKHIPCKYKSKFDGENVIQINSGIEINVDASENNTIYVTTIVVGILLHVVAKMVNR